MKHKFKRLWADFAEDVSKLSHCVRAQQGCVLTSLDGERMLAFGYNGNYRGGPNQCSGPNEPGKCECVHAEANALVKTRSQEPFVAFITQMPCLACAKLLINSGCQKVFYNRRYRDLTGMLTAKKVGLEMEYSPWWTEQQPQ